MAIKDRLRSGVTALAGHGRRGITALAGHGRNGLENFVNFVSDHEKGIKKVVVIGGTGVAAGSVVASYLGGADIGDMSGAEYMQQSAHQIADLAIDTVVGMGDNLRSVPPVVGEYVVDNKLATGLGGVLAGLGIKNALDKRKEASYETSIATLNDVDVDYRGRAKAVESLRTFAKDREDIAHVLLQYDYAQSLFDAEVVTSDEITPTVALLKGMTLFDSTLEQNALEGLEYSRFLVSQGDSVANVATKKDNYQEAERVLRGVLDARGGKFKAANVEYKAVAEKLKTL